MIAWVTLALLMLVLVTATVTDIRTGRIYNWLTLPAMLTGLIWNLLLGFFYSGSSGALTGLGDAFLGLLAGLVPFGFIVIWLGLGGGDAKLMAAVGAITASWQCVLETAIHAFFVGAFIALILMLRHRIVGRTIRRLANAFLLAAAKVKPEIPEDSPKIPFALAIAIGAVPAFLHTKMGMILPWL